MSVLKAKGVATMKLIYVRFRGLKDHSRFEFSLMVLPRELTVSEFKSLWGDGIESVVVYAPTRVLPLHEEARLYDYVQDWDTVTIASPWVNAQGEAPQHVR